MIALQCQEVKQWQGQVQRAGAGPQGEAEAGAVAALPPPKAVDQAL